MRAVTLIDVSVLLIAVALIPATEAATAGERTFIAPGWNAGDAVCRPTSFWASGNATLRFTKIKWSSYGTKTAKAHASGHTNDCDPTCADGHMSAHPVQIVYDRARKQCGRRFFTRLKITWTADVPDGYRRSGYFIDSKGLDVTC